jgi:hypothetical protein
MISAAAMGLLGATLATAPAASAATPPNCPKDGQSLCVYEHNNYGGQMRVFKVNASCNGDGSGTGTCQWVSFFKQNLTDVGWSDRISSIANHTNVRIDCYRDVNEGGPTFFLAPTWEFDTVGLNNDSFSSCASLDH